MTRDCTPAIRLSPVLRTSEYSGEWDESRRGLQCTSCCTGSNTFHYTQDWSTAKSKTLKVDSKVKRKKGSWVVAIITCVYLGIMQGTLFVCQQCPDVMAPQIPHTGVDPVAVVTPTCRYITVMSGYVPSTPILIFLSPFSLRTSFAMSLFSKYLKNRNRSVFTTPDNGYTHRGRERETERGREKRKVSNG